MAVWGAVTQTAPEVTVQIHWRNPHAVSAEEREAVEDRIHGLAEGHSDLIDIWIDLEESTHHRRGADSVTLRCQARGTEIVTHGQGDEPTPALRIALDTFERDVKRMRERRTDRRSERPPAPPQLGIVDRVFPEKGYGFLLTDSGEQVYFHENAVGSGLRFSALQEGERVALDTEQGDKGPQATFVAPAPPEAPVP